MMTASGLEVVWSLIALLGLIAAAHALQLAWGDLQIAKSANEPSAVIETGGQQVRQWLGSVIKCACLLIMGIQAMFLPSVPGRGTSALISGVCLIVICIVVALSPIAYLRNRARVLKSEGT